MLAAQLGDAGFDVVLADAAVFSSSTLSTHFFRGVDMVDILDDLGVLDEVLDREPPKLTEVYFYANSEERSEAPFDEGLRDAIGHSGFHLCVTREFLDHLLVRRAQRAGSVTVLQATRLRELILDGSRVVGARLEREGEEVEVEAHVTVGADGRQSTVARLTGTVDACKDPAARAIYYAYVRRFRPRVCDRFDGMEFSLVGDEMGYVLPCDDGMTCLGVSVNLERFGAMRGRYREAFWDRLADHPGLAARVAEAHPASEVFAYGPQPSYVRRPGLAYPSRPVVRPRHGLRESACVLRGGCHHGGAERG